MPETLEPALTASKRVGVPSRRSSFEPGSPWENGYIESFNARLRDELLNGEIFFTLEEVRIITGQWREHYNKVRPHSALGYRPPAPEAIHAAAPSQVH